MIEHIKHNFDNIQAINVKNCGRIVFLHWQYDKFVLQFAKLFQSITTKGNLWLLPIKI